MESLPPRPAEPEESRGLRLLGPGLILGSAIAMFIWSFGKWADPIIDFGRELYVPWQLMEGKRLYADLAYYYGPVSPYVNLAWFQLFGMSYLSLVAGNALVFLAILGLIWSLLRKVSGTFAATVAGLIAVLVFGFGQYVDIGNYNFMSPYSHEVTHGLLLAFAAIGALHRFSVTARRRWLVACGLLLGLTFLTKHEVFVAASGSLGVGLFFLLRANPRPETRFAIVGTFLGACATPLLLAFGLLSLQSGPAVAFRGILGPYPFLLNAEVWANPFFADRSGATQPWRQFGSMLRWSAAIAGIVAASLGLRQPAARHVRLQPILAAAVFLLPFAAQAILGNLVDWRGVLTPLPLFLLAGVVWLTRQAWRESGPSTLPHSALPGLTLAVFSLLLLLKMPLNTRVYHYGFAMAMPGTLLVVVAWLDIIPRHLKLSGTGLQLFRAGGVGALSLFALVHLVSSFVFFSTRTHSLGEGANHLWVDRRGAIIDAAVHTVSSSVRPGQTLVVFPEGAMINFLTRRPSSVAHITFLPTDFSQFGESSLLRQLQEHPPDFVLLLSTHVRDLREYGCLNFGEDCGSKVGSWMREHYRGVLSAQVAGLPLYSLLVRSDVAAGEILPE